MRSTLSKFAILYLYKIVRGRGSGDASRKIKLQDSIFCIKQLKIDFENKSV